MAASKTCVLCQEVKLLGEFSLKGSSKTVRLDYCTECQEDLARAKRLREIFNLSLWDYEAILAFQGGRCAICKRYPKEDGNRLAVDHDHKSGLIRGCLCWKCNRLLGILKDDLGIALAVAEYLTSPPATTALGGPRHGRKGRTTNKRPKRKRASTARKKK